MSGTSEEKASVLTALQSEFYDAVIARFEDGELWRIVLNIFLVGGGTLLGAIGRLGVAEGPVATTLTITGLSLAFFGLAVATFFDFRRKDLTKKAKAALEFASGLRDEEKLLIGKISAAGELDERRRYLIQAIQQMQEAVEQMPHGQNLDVVVKALLDAGSSDLEGACGFQPGEHWGFSIFRREKETLKKNSPWVLRRFAVTGANRQWENNHGDARFWRKKEGFTGVSWQNDDEVIEADLTDPEVTNRYPVPPRKRKPMDAEEYVSVAVIPIRVGRSDEMWGSVTATSNKRGRFARAITNPDQHNVTVVRMLAQLIAMQISLREGNDLPLQERER